MSQVAFNYGSNGANQIMPTNASATVTWNASTRVYPVGVYSYNAIRYPLNAGLNRFRVPLVNCTNMIAGDASTPIELLTAASWLISYGDADDRGAESEATWLNDKFAKSRTGLLAMTCGNNCTYVRRNILDVVGIQSRVVRFVTLGTPNNYADGHVCLEVRIGNEWVLVDCSNNTLFRRMNNSFMPAKEAPAALDAGQVVRQKLAIDGANNAEPVPNATFDASGWFIENVMGQEDNWQRTIFDAVGFDHSDGNTYWLLPNGFTPAQQAWIEGLSANWKVRDLAFINANFYS